jgi:hypothetical protein
LTMIRLNQPSHMTFELYVLMVMSLKLASEQSEDQRTVGRSSRNKNDSMETSMRGERTLLACEQSLQVEEKHRAAEQAPDEEEHPRDTSRRHIPGEHPVEHPKEDATPTPYKPPTFGTQEEQLRSRSMKNNPSA